MRKAVAVTAKSKSQAALWIRERIAPLLEDQDAAGGRNLDLLRLPMASLSLSPQIRKDWGGKIVKQYGGIALFIEALDRTNFLGILDREASDEEFACVVLLKNAWLGWPPPQRLAKGPLSAEQIIAEAAKTVRKSRIQHGRPHYIRKLQASARYPDMYPEIEMTVRRH